jgi:hypothetical protein
MRVIPEQFTKGDYAYTQLRKEGDLAIFKRVKRNQPWPEFEVIVIRFKGEHRFPSGTLFEGGELYPSTAEFGTYGKSCVNLDRANYLFGYYKEHRTWEGALGPDEWSQMQSKAKGPGK